MLFLVTSCIVTETLIFLNTLQKQIFGTRWSLDGTSKANSNSGNNKSMYVYQLLLKCFNACMLLVNIWVLRQHEIKRGKQHGRKRHFKNVRNRAFNIFWPSYLKTQYFFFAYPCKAEKSGSNGNFTKINIVVKKITMKPVNTKRWSIQIIFLVN